MPKDDLAFGTEDLVERNVKPAVVRNAQRYFAAAPLGANQHIGDGFPLGDRDIGPTQAARPCRQHLCCFSSPDRRSHMPGVRDPMRKVVPPLLAAAGDESRVRASLERTPKLARFASRADLFIHAAIGQVEDRVVRHIPRPHLPDVSGAREETAMLSVGGAGSLLEHRSMEPLPEAGVAWAETRGRSERRLLPWRGLTDPPLRRRVQLGS